MASREVDEAVGEAPFSLQQKLEAKRAELAAARQQLSRAHRELDTDAAVEAQTRITVLEAMIATLEIDADLENEANAEKRAKARVLGIRKAVGSLSNEMEEDAEVVRQAYGKLVDAIKRINARSRQAAQYCREASALVDRFGFDDKVPQEPTPPSVRLSDLEPLPLLLDVSMPIRPFLEDHEETSWQRRTYEEIAGTPGFEIIKAVGPKPWPPLSPEQQAQIDARKLREQREAAAVNDLPPIPPQGDFPIANMF